MGTPARNIAVIGCTGSIGLSCLDVVDRFPDRFQVVGLAAGRNVDLLAAQVKKHGPRVCSVIAEEDARRLRAALGAEAKVEILWGVDGLTRTASLDEADVVVSAVVGAAGLPATWAAVRAGKRVALANKESLVVAGELVVAAARRSGAVLLPVDSEHSAIFQCLNGQRREDVRRLILTASGGPFRGFDAARLAAVTPKQALAHPKWDMGAKISIDSATLMNKGLEAIEARWLFGLPLEKIAIHVHPQSIVHSMVEYVDGSVIAQLGLPDMRAPIAYALSYPERLPLGLPGLDLPKMEALRFEEPDYQRFPCLALALEAGRRGGAGPAVLNAANEVAVEAFLNGRISFPGIAEVVRRVLETQGDRPAGGLEQLTEADGAARTAAWELVNNNKGVRGL